jgi:hypothetical protein
MAKTIWHASTAVLTICFMLLAGLYLEPAWAFNAGLAWGCFIGIGSLVAYRMRATD